MRLATLMIFQTFIHVGVNTSLIPTTGMTLPFLSYGGSSLIGSAILAGVILNIQKIKPICMTKNKSTNSSWRNGRSCFSGI